MRKAVPWPGPARCRAERKRTETMVQAFVDGQARL